MYFLSINLVVVIIVIEEAFKACCKIQVENFFMSINLVVVIIVIEEAFKASCKIQVENFFHYQIMSRTKLPKYQ